MIPKSIQRQRTALFSKFEADRVYRQKDLQQLLRERRDALGLPAKFRFEDFLEFAMEAGSLQAVVLKSDAYDSATRYVWGELSVYSLALSLKNSSYLSHGTAVFLRGLSDELPKVIHVNAEQSTKPAPKGALTQAGLDRAFSSNQRQSRYVFSYAGRRIVVLSGKNSGQLEVGTIDGPAGELLRATKVERTLIDITVRPMYAGGIPHVLEVFENAREQVSTNVLVSTLKKLDYKYPYHQAIGFMMERAGYRSEQLSRLRSLGLEFDFYLAHGMREPLYNKDWRLFYPQGL